MNKKILMICLVSFTLAQSLFAAERQKTVHSSRHDKWREIALFPYLNGMSCKNYWPAVSDELAFFDRKAMILSMGDGQVKGIQEEDIPLVEVVLNEVKEAYARFNAQAKK